MSSEDIVTHASGIEVVTFGCRLNVYESEVMRAHALSAGLKDAVIVNTCAVTAEAERQARQHIRKIRREKPNARIIVTGCAAQVHSASYAAMKEIDHLLGNEAKMKAETFHALSEAPRLQVSDIQEARQATAHPVQGFEGIARAFVQVQNGCDHRCTFCIIPYGRGPSRSVPVGVVAEQVRALVVQGYREIVMTGVDITAYGADLPGKPTLGQMIRRVLALNPGLPRLRLSSVDPKEMDEDLWHLIAHEPRLMPHLHLSLQAGDDVILKRMKRRHNSQDVRDVVARARTLRPDIVFGADVIAGFPTETDAMFENTKRLIEETGITWLHVFPYSAREGTPAARMPQISGRIRKERAAILRELGVEAVQRHLDSLQGQAVEVLVEKNDCGVALGRTACYAQVRFESTLPAGPITRVFIHGQEGEMLLASEYPLQAAA
jgi:threonylcarbamoyladenosine tRNA methylthiotransferase MtaB